MIHKVIKKKEEEKVILNTTKKTMMYIKRDTRILDILKVPITMSKPNFKIKNRIED